MIDQVKALITDFSSFAIWLCKLLLSHSMCSYFPVHYSEGILKHKIQYLLKTNYFCAHILHVCPQEFKPFDVLQFKEEIYKLYPLHMSENSFLAQLRYQ